VQRILALALSLAIQASALSAPLVHAHPDDHETEHHGARAIHTHWTAHAEADHSSEGEAPELEAEDHDRAVFLNVFVAVAASVIDVPAVAQVVFALPAPAERSPHHSVESLHSHDPPVIPSPSPRAPPSFLS
jgi:hypothetical protein